MVRLVNRARELASLEELVSRPGGTMALVWGRRRVGKTALLQSFAEGRRSVYHIATGRPPADELAALSAAAAPVLEHDLRDLRTRPFRDWDEALEVLGEAASDEPLLVVLDEFPEAASTVPELPSLLRAFWDHAKDRTKLSLVICGS
ncbi:MAG TPA: ATP-binding protein, partial [Gaiellaceae bacterium]|nr:ATP-binding protein [Gaiellaceae bacterium]